MELFSIIVLYNYHFVKLKSDYLKGFKSVDVIGVVQHHAFLSIQGNNTVKINIC